MFPALTLADFSRMKDTRSSLYLCSNDMFSSLDGKQLRTNGCGEFSLVSERYTIIYNNLAA